MTTFGIGWADVSKSIQMVVEAINQTSYFSMKFPEEHDSQHQLAKQFGNKSAAGFDCCVGAVDGILLWIHRPSEDDAAAAGCGPAKFFCGRKHKYGLNCQAVCDAKGRFLDMSILFPGSTSDVLSFESSTLHHKLQNGLLAPGLCLFGDNAYINSPFMATPYSGISGGSKDAYNFYHSQLRINIECAFGRFVHRWAILRGAIPMNIGIAKTTAMVLAMAKLHNFSILENDMANENTAADNWRIEMNGGVPMVPAHEGRFSIPVDLLGSGNHFDDIDNNARRRRERVYSSGRNTLPRERLLAVVEEKGLTRPPPTRSRH
jgi:hypothetical protein